MENEKDAEKAGRRFYMVYVLVMDKNNCVFNVLVKFFLKLRKYILNLVYIPY